MRREAEIDDLARLLAERHCLRLMTGYCTHRDAREVDTFLELFIPEGGVAQQGKLQSAFAGWGRFAVNDVSALLSDFYTKGAFAMAHDVALAALVNQAGSNTDAARRKAMYAQALRIISERAYTIPVFTEVKTYAFSRQLEFTPYADGNPRFYRAKWQQGVGISAP